MNHYAASSFWDAYNQLPKNIQVLSKMKFELLKINTNHPSLHFKKVDTIRSVRIGLKYRALGTDIYPARLILPHSDAFGSRPVLESTSGFLRKNMTGY